MGCDWIGAGETCFGYELMYRQVFANTQFSNLETLVYVEESGNENEHYQQFGNCSAENALIKAWYHYLEIYHPDALNFKIQVFVGCNTMPGSYQASVYVHHCSVVFGFNNFTPVASNVNGETIHSLSYRFPDNITTIITGFLIEFQKNSSNSKQQIKVEVSQCLTAPRLISFVR